MRRRSYKHYIRKIHRYLGIVIGIQFLFWTVGGLYFSWTKIEEIRSEHIRTEPAPVELPPGVLSPNVEPRRSLPPQATFDAAKLRIIDIFGEPHYSLPYRSDDNASLLVVSLRDGTRRQPIDEIAAIETAKRALTVDLPLENVEFLEPGSVSKHHEYRGRPLPAYAVNFAGSDQFTVYVSVNDWQVQTVRSNKWRAFDLLWMLHTLDLDGRDNINNYLLRAFSIFGVLTILSGFLLFFVSSRQIRRLIRR